MSVLNELVSEGGPNNRSNSLFWAIGNIMVPNGPVLYAVSTSTYQESFEAVVESLSSLRRS